MSSGFKIKKSLSCHLATEVVKNSHQVQIFSCQIEEMQSIGIHDILNAQEFVLHCRAISNFFKVRGSFTLMCFKKKKVLNQT